MKSSNNSQVTPTLTIQEQEWFEKLTEDRTQTVKYLKKAGLIDVFVSHIVDTYRESAHFIYELLQNADDVGATQARFHLKSDGILFAHNGTVPFSLSDVDLERNSDAQPGHVNSITTFSLSTKKEEIENKIGKFGIGFKSVFQYTNTPFVYNPPYYFKIENFMIPTVIEEDQDLFSSDETTVFWLPFNKVDKNAAQAFKEISNKLMNIKNPLLFLRSLNYVDVQVNGNNFSFSKKLERIESFNITNVEIHKVTLDKTQLIRFDKKVTIRDNKGIKHLLPINLGFVLDEDDNITSKNEYSHLFKHAWCFFPTYQQTGINYVLNAPFILTPNREALKEDRIENTRLLSALEVFIGEAIQGLKFLGYINEPFFATITNPDHVPNEFKPFAKKVVEKLSLGEFIPTIEGDHIGVNNAFISTQEPLTNLLSFENYSPLRRLVNKSKARIVFRNRKIFDNSQFIFIYKNFSGEGIELNANWLGARYEVNFLENSPKEFILMFFKYLAENHTAILSKNQPLWKKKFIRVDRGIKEKLFVSPNDSLDRPQTYISNNKTSGRYTIVEYLNRDETIRVFLINVLKSKVPDEFDDFILSLIKYEKPKTLGREEVYKDFNTIIKFLKTVSQVQKEKLLSELKQYSFLPVTNGNSFEIINPNSQVAYYPSKELKEYFSKSEEEKLWVESQNLQNDLSEFASLCYELDIETKPYYNSQEDTIDGLEEFILNLTLPESIYITEILIHYDHNISFDKKLNILRTKEWLFNKEEIICLPCQIKEGELHKDYNPIFNRIHRELGAYIDPNEKRYANLNENERKALEALGDSINHLSPEEIHEAVSDFLNTKKRQKVNKELNENERESITPENLLESWTSDSFSTNGNTNNNRETFINDYKLKPTDFWENELGIEDTIPENPGGYVSASIIGNSYKDDQKKTKQAQLEKELQIESLRHEWIELAQTQEPYSFGWFKTLLELEDNFTMENRIKKNPVRVIFSTARLDEDGLLELSGTPYIPPHIEDIGEISIQLFFDDQKKTIKGEVVSPKKKILKIKLGTSGLLDFEDLSKINRAIVQASSPDFILEKLKTAFFQLPFEDSDNLKRPDIVPQDIQFIFGPPGTGKTTYLSWLIGGKNPAPIFLKDEQVEPILTGVNSNKKILVLTPTNKAADVLAERIIENYVKDGDYPDWLIRFGETGSLEDEPVFVRDKKVKPWIKDKCTLVTTVARFPYDGFTINSNGENTEKWLLKDFDWDYIIFDEASMIQQAAILYTILYTQQFNKKVKFVIGGDPFQIPPIIQFEFPYWSYIPDPAFDPEGNPILDENGIQVAWKQDGGNIYSFTGLSKDDSFTNPITEPHQFIIHNLQTQFRSLPSIGTLFSKYRYGGILKHYRGNNSTDNRHAPKNFEVKNLPLSSLNIIKFPVKKYEGIYRSRSVKGSPYHIYSAIFSVELIKYIQQNIKTNSEIPYRIGIISPYALQNRIVSKLIEKIDPGPIEIITGTVHGFQGDECDLVIVILNPPRTITRSIRSFLNKKNILNVAISRARDKMILMVPYDSDNEVNVHDLHQIRYLETLAGSIPECRNEVTGYLAENVEEALWGQKTYIEDNAFHTSHQDVNIYVEAAKRYEIRQDENAVDVQVKWK